MHYLLGRAFGMLGNREEAAKHLAIVKNLKETRGAIIRERFKELAK